MHKLANTALSVRVFNDRPIIQSYWHKPSDSRFAGGDHDGVMTINGAPVDWSRWQVTTRSEGQRVSYRLHLLPDQIGFEITFHLDENALVMELGNIEDANKERKTIGWKGLALITCDAPEFQYWRLGTTEPDAASVGKMWLQDGAGSLEKSKPDPAPVPVVYGALFHPAKNWVSIHSKQLSALASDPPIVQGQAVRDVVERLPVPGTEQDDAAFGGSRGLRDRHEQ
jgi:hypothetical protein